MKRSERILDGFSRWFASAAGVWQTAIITGLIVAAERVFPHIDPNGFWLLYLLTVYSGITQPALAYVGTLANKKLDTVLEHVTTDADADLAEDQAQTALLRALTDQVAGLRAELAQLRGER